MKYYRYGEDDSLIGGGTRFIEVDDGYVIREVTLNGDRFLGSNVCYPHWGMMLSESRCDYEAIEEVTAIAQAEFGAVWDAHLSQNAGRWALIKHAYAIDIQVQGRIAIFYPQGVIVDLGDSGTLGVADYDTCRASTKPEFMYSKHRITAIVNGYDEQNHWLLLGSPQVQEDIVRDPYWWV